MPNRLRQFILRYIPSRPKDLLVHEAFMLACLVPCLLLSDSLGEVLLFGSATAFTICMAARSLRDLARYRSAERGRSLTDSDVET